MLDNDQGADHSISKFTEVSAVKPPACAILPVAWKQEPKPKIFGNNEEQTTKRSFAVKREQPDIISSFTQQSQPDVKTGIAERSAGLSSAIAVVLSVRRK